jgi:hypothetical protein
MYTFWLPLLVYLLRYTIIRGDTLMSGKVDAPAPIIWLSRLVSLVCIRFLRELLLFFFLSALERLR